MAVGFYNFKVEFEDIKAISNCLNRPFHQVEELVRKKMMKKDE